MAWERNIFREKSVEGYTNVHAYTECKNQRVTLHSVPEFKAVNYMKMRAIN